ncbi:hypothetical protein [Hydrogenimonas urashimensis]|uniref:hypothetical protein n=1 Tax=Hydrogenimonas urashimensis TaxID=2740515 RepID=UPI001F384CC8|nr:hypothetical protein [Hydrogenimonas urashimensis]
MKKYRIAIAGSRYVDPSNGLLLAQHSEIKTIIKSMTPIGFTKFLKKKFKTENIIFSSKFSRKSKTLYYNLYPGHIIVKEQSKRVGIFANLLAQSAKER